MDMKGAEARPLQEQAALLCDDPAELYGHNLTRMQTQSRAEYEPVQLAALKRRFSAMRDAIPMLQKLADAQGIDVIGELNDVVPLLFDHTMYKSYPASILYENRFDQLTKWLNKLTAYDISGFDPSGCKTIDEWLTALDEQTPLRVSHTSGTSGLFSFLPRSKDDWRRFVDQYRLSVFQAFGDEAPADAYPYEVDTIYPHFRHGAGHQRLNDPISQHICGGEDRFHAAYPGRLNSEMTLLSARMRAAQKQGKLDSLQIPPDLLARQQEYVKLQQDMDGQLKAFFDRMIRELKGKKVFIKGSPPILMAMAEQGLARGERQLFHPDSIILCGGGAKGMVLPDNWEEMLMDFVGAPHLTKFYGMMESLVFMPMCSEGRYHMMPSLIPFILDPETSEPLPRTGQVTGRWAHYDLLSDSMWGGFISGDEVTMEWDQPCGCGRRSAYIHAHVQRFSEKITGDDKITCTATQEAFDEAMDFLTSFQG